MSFQQKWSFSSEISFVAVLPRTPCYATLSQLSKLNFWNERYLDVAAISRDSSLVAVVREPLELREALHVTY